MKNTIEMTPGKGEFNLWNEYKRVVTKALKKHSNNLGNACKELGISTRTGVRYVQLFDIEGSFTNYSELTRLKKLCRKNSWDFMESDLGYGIFIPSLKADILKKGHVYDIVGPDPKTKLLFPQVSEYLLTNLKQHT